jgi:DNA-binding MarR family transcriptional regulator
MDQVDDREELARRAWRLLMGAGQRHLETVTDEIEEMGLSKVMAQFLGAVCQSPPGPTNQLATRFGVDPSWVTDIVDRLEARGELVRRPSPDDRRVKILEVTEAGQETFRKMEAIFATPPLELLDAPREDLLALVRIAERLAGTTQVPDAVEA